MKTIDVNGHLNIQQMNKLVISSKSEILTCGRVTLLILSALDFIIRK